MARLIFKKIKKDMVFKGSGEGRQPDERIFRVARRTNKPKRVFLSCPAAFTKREWDDKPGIGMVELDFTMEQLNRLLVPMPEDTSGWFVGKD